MGPNFKSMANNNENGGGELIDLHSHPDYEGGTPPDIRAAFAPLIERIESERKNGRFERDIIRVSSGALEKVYGVDRSSPSFDGIKSLYDLAGNLLAIDDPGPIMENGAEVSFEESLIGPIMVLKFPYNKAPHLLMDLDCLKRLHLIRIINQDAENYSVESLDSVAFKQISVSVPDAERMLCIVSADTDGPLQINFTVCAGGITACHLSNTQKLPDGPLRDTLIQNVLHTINLTLDGSELDLHPDNRNFVEKAIGALHAGIEKVLL